MNIGISLGSGNCTVACATTPAASATAAASDSHPTYPHACVPAPAGTALEIVANDSGERATPIAVALLQDELVSGATASRQAYVKYPLETVNCILPFMFPQHFAACGGTHGRVGPAFETLKTKELTTTTTTRTAATEDGEEEDEEDVDDAVTSTKASLPRSKFSVVVKDGDKWMNEGGYCGDLIKIEGLVPCDEEEEGKEADDGEEDESKLMTISSVFTKFLTSITHMVENAAAGKDVRTLTLSLPRYCAPSELLTPLVEASGLASLAQRVRFVYNDVSALALAVPPSVLFPPPPSSSLSFADASSAAALAFVVDWGENVLSVSAFFVNPPQRSGATLQLLFSKSLTQDVGGAALDLWLAKDISGTFCRKHRGIEAPGNSSRAMRKLLVAAEGTKLALSSSTAAPICIEAFHEGMDLNENVSRTRLESLLHDKKLMPRALQLVGEVAQKAVSLLLLKKQQEEGVTAAAAAAAAAATPLGISVDHIVLCGGMFRVPLVQAGVGKAQVAKAVSDAATAAIQEHKQQKAALSVSPTATAAATAATSGGTTYASNEMCALGAAVLSTQSLPGVPKGIVGPPRDGDKATEAIGSMLDDTEEYGLVFGAKSGGAGKAGGGGKGGGLSKKNAAATRAVAASSAQPQLPFLRGGVFLYTGQGAEGLSAMDIQDDDEDEDEDDSEEEEGAKKTKEENRKKKIITMARGKCVAILPPGSATPLPFATRLKLPEDASSSKKTTLLFGSIKSVNNIAANAADSSATSSSSVIALICKVELEPATPPQSELLLVVSEEGRCRLLDNATGKVIAMVA